ncbi:hypothetical protein MYX82_07910 [Acidobacteria bacterium AH-259-D05]|nr:hypothetical protein [Acidobacteria bacterium AH-259-D05]
MRSIEAPLDPLTYGSRVRLPIGDSYVMAIQSEGALQIRVHFSDFNVPPGGKVYVHTLTGFEDLYGPYEDTGPFQDGSFVTPPIRGDTVVIEYLDPNPQLRSRGAVPPFLISEISHVFAEPSVSAVDPQAGSCHLNVPSDWQSIAKAVGGFSFVKGNNVGWCTGTLIGGKSHDYTPYFLTANHCVDSEEVARTVTVYWLFDGPGQSLFDRPHSDFATLLSTQNALIGTDYTLMMILGTLPRANLCWSGWTTMLPSSSQPVVSIHHPNGDNNINDAFKRIAYGTIESLNESICEFVIEVPVNCSNFLSVDWEAGGTEAGSSGSGLWIADGTPKFVGQLLGGAKKPCDPVFGGVNVYYGRFDLTYSHISGYLAGGTDDSFEENDSRSLAKAIGDGSWTDLLVKWFDDDWYRVDVPSGGRLSIRLDFIHAHGNINLQVFRDNDSRPTALGTSLTDNESVLAVGGGTYFVRVFLADDTRNTYDLSIKVDGPSSLSAPSNLIATATSPATVHLNWQDNSSDESGFYIERSLSGTDSWTLIASVGTNVTEYLDQGLGCDRAFLYRIRAYREVDGVYSSYSNTGQARTLACGTCRLQLLCPGSTPCS